MAIHPAVGQLLHVDGQTERQIDMIALIVAFRLKMTFSITNIRTNWHGAQIMHKVSNEFFFLKKMAK
jgi:hypothetical protein